MKIPCLFWQPIMGTICRKTGSLMNRRVIISRFFFFGNVIKDAYRGKKITGTGSQTDIATTLLQQLQITDTAFKWGNDLLNPGRKPFAFYTFDDGFAWLTAKDTLIFDNRAKRLMYPSEEITSLQSDSILTTGKAYMQVLYDAFLKY